LKTNIIAIILTFQVFASVDISKSEEVQLIRDLVTTLEQKALDTGHNYIDSKTEEFNLNSLNFFLSGEHRFMQDMLRDQDIEDITNCIELLECAAYRITIASEYQAGYGFDYHIVFLNKVNSSLIIKTFAGYNE
jgi:hypothetical protein